LEWRVKEKGVTIVPTLLWINEKGYAKLTLPLRIDFISVPFSTIPAVIVCNR
jgi:hypothetical protein